MNAFLTKHPSISAFVLVLAAVMISIQWLGKTDTIILMLAIQAIDHWERAFGKP